jgi:hypothetical protein
MLQHYEDGARDDRDHVPFRQLLHFKCEHWSRQRSRRYCATWKDPLCTPCGGESMHCAWRVGTVRRGRTGGRREGGGWLGGMGESEPCHRKRGLRGRLYCL